MYEKSTEFKILRKKWSFWQNLKLIKIFYETSNFFSNKISNSEIMIYKNPIHLEHF
jgi:hypothetical protein